MTAVAVFDINTNVTSEIFESVLSELWIYKSINVILNIETKFTTCILKYIFHSLEEEKSIKDIVGYLLGISLEGYIYYYPSWECYEYDEEDKDEEISINAEGVTSIPETISLTGLKTAK